MLSMESRSCDVDDSKASFNSMSVSSGLYFGFDCSFEIE